MTDPLPEREPMRVLASQDLAGDHGDQDMKNLAAPRVEAVT